MAERVAPAHSGCTPAQGTLAVVARRVRVAAAGWAAAVEWAAAVGRDWQVNTAPEDFVDPGRIAIHNRVVAAAPVVPAGAGAVAVRRFPNSRSVNQDISCLPAQHNILGRF